MRTDTEKHDISTSINWRPWALAIAAWMMSCLIALGILHTWHEREEQVLESQANSLVHALANVLRTMSSGQVKQSEGVLDEVFAEVTQGTAIDGVVLVNEAGQCLASAGMPEQGPWNEQTQETGSLHRKNDLLVWDVVDVGQCVQGRRGLGGWGRKLLSGRLGEERNAMRLFVSIPLDSLRARWQRDRVVIAVICMVFLGLASTAAASWTLKQRSATYSEKLHRAAEEKQSLEEINLVAAGIAHEIKNPLGVIRGVVQRLLNHSVPPGELDDALPVVINEIDRTTSRINELLSFSNPKTPILEKISPGEHIRDLERLLADELEDTGIELNIENQIGLLKADPELFRRLLFNLIHNAMRFAPDSDVIKVAATRDSSGSGVLTVRDHGPGIAPDLTEKVFSAYYTTSPEGTGLGLAVVRRIVRAHDWKITCGPAPGGGAVFKITGIKCNPDDSQNAGD